MNNKFIIVLLLFSLNLDGGRSLSIYANEGAKLRQYTFKEDVTISTVQTSKTYPPGVYIPMKDFVAHTKNYVEISRERDTLKSLNTRLEEDLKSYDKAMLLLDRVNDTRSKIQLEIDRSTQRLRENWNDYSKIQDKIVGQKDREVRNLRRQNTMEKVLGWAKFFSGLYIGSKVGKVF